MTELLIKTKDGNTHKAKLPMHFMVAEEYKVDLDDIVAVGFVTKDREIWLDRKPR